MDYLPWWSLALLAYLVLHHPGKIFDDFDHNSLLGAPSSQSFGEGLSDALAPLKKFGWTQPGRRLQDSQAAEKALGAVKVNVTIPCLSLPIIGDAFKPCGNLSIGPHGLDVETPFGIKHIPGSDALMPDVKRLDKTFSQYTAYFVGGSVAVYAILTVISQSRSHACFTHLHNMFSGNLNAHPDDEETIKERMDPKSTNFIAPGNIYRLLAVLHPGIIGFSAWMGFASKAFICAYMQIYIPYTMISNFFQEWTFFGVKTPLWFLTNGTQFVLMFASVGSICQLFAQKCCEHIRSGAEANFYIMTHHAPELPSGEASAGGSNKTTPLLADATEAANAADQVGEEAVSKSIGWIQRKYPHLVPKLILANVYFWCCLSMCLNVCMSFLLFLAMFFKIATFTGKITDVALVAVALYFVFDLDDKVFESDPSLRPRYRKVLLAEKEEGTYKPIWLKTIAGFFRTIVSLLTPVGLIMIFLCAWKSDDIVIGGDPF